MKKDYSDFSELEREFELQMEDAPVEGFELELDGDFELDHDDEYPDETEVTFEQAEESETAPEGDYDDVQRSREFVERLREISGRQFESSAEVDEAMNEVLDDIEREYFFGPIGRGLKNLRKSKLLTSLAKKGLKLGVNKFFPGLQGALQLARGNVKRALLDFGKQAIGSVVPGGGVMLDAAAKSIGLGGSGDPAQERETWENYVGLARESYEHLADNLTPTADQPAEAIRLANNALQHAIAKAQARTISGGGGRAGRGRVVRLRVAPGERIKLIITGA
jgi:hypothetical protein